LCAYIALCLLDRPRRRNLALQGIPPNAYQVDIRNNPLIIIDPIDTAVQNSSSELRSTNIGNSSGDQIRGSEEIRLNAAPECDVRPDHSWADDVSLD